MQASQDIRTCDGGGFFMQADTIPFGVFREKLNEVQENVFTLTTEMFSRYLVYLGDMSESDRLSIGISDVKRQLVKAGFRTDKASNLVVEIDPKEVMPKSTKPGLVREWCRQLSAIQVRFRIAEWNGMRNMEAIQSLFVGIIAPEDMDSSGNGHVFLSLNNWAIPYFLFYGAYDIYFGKVQKQIALSLKGQTTKRIYKMVCSMYGKKGNRCEMSLDELRKMLNLTGEIRRKNVVTDDDEQEFYVVGKKTYRRSDNIRKVLDRARDDIKASGADYFFDYELLSRNHNGQRGRQKMDTVVFTVHNRGRSEVEAPDQERLYGEVADLLRTFANYDLIQVMSVLEDTRRILDAGAAEVVLRKHAYYKEKLLSTNPYDDDAPLVYRKQLRHEFNIIYKILSEDYGLLLNKNPRNFRKTR